MKTITFEIDGEKVLKVDNSPLKIFVYKGQKFASGLFQMHDEQGFSLTDSLQQCKRFGLVPCIHEFEAEALAAGWSREKVDRTIKEAMTDA